MGWALLAAVTAISASSASARTGHAADGPGPSAAGALRRRPGAAGSVVPTLGHPDRGCRPRAPTVAALVVPSRRRATVLLSVSGTFVAGLVSRCLPLGAPRRAGPGRTVYPGARRFSGALTSLPSLFAAPAPLDPAAHSPGRDERVGDRLRLPGARRGLAVLFPAIVWACSRGLRVVALVSGLVLLALTGWCTLDWPLKANVLFPMSLVSAGGWSRSWVCARR